MFIAILFSQCSNIGKINIKLSASKSKTGESQLFSQQKPKRGETERIKYFILVGRNLICSCSMPGHYHHFEIQCQFLFCNYTMTEHDTQLKMASLISDVKVEEKNEQVQSEISSNRGKKLCPISTKSAAKGRE
jgi:hypothetical protein